MADNIPALECEVSLHGAKDPNNKLTIDIDPCVTPGEYSSQKTPVSVN